MREKLIELIGRVQDEGLDYSDVVCVYKTSNGRLADYLIANGVTIPVRCKDCKHWLKADNGSWHMVGRTDGICRMLNDIHHAERYMTEGEHFCSYGERRTDDRETG